MGILPMRTKCARQSSALPRATRPRTSARQDRWRQASFWTRSEKSIGATTIIHGADLRIDPGEFVVFVGPAGSGKSTLLRMIAGVEEISGGALLFNGERVNELPAAKRGIALVSSLTHCTRTCRSMRT